MEGLIREALEIGAPIALYMALAVIVWSGARWLVGLTLRGLGRALDRHHLDLTIGRTVASAVGIALNVALVVSILAM